MARETIQSKTIEADAENIRQAAHHLASDMQRVSEALGDLAGNSWETIQQKLVGLYEQGKGRYANAESRFTEKIKTNPMESVLIAAGIGFICGLLKRKKSRE